MKVFNMILKVYEISDGETHFYVAQSPEEAMQLHMTAYMLPNCDGFDVQEMPDDYFLTIRDDIGNDERKACSEWVLDGKGLLGSTCF